MLLEPPRPIQPVPEDAEPYGEVCTTNTDSVFREGDAVDLGFKLVGREPYCHGESLYPWNWGELSCDSYKDATPSASQPIDIEIIDGVSGTKTSTTCDGDFDYTMNVTVINPFAPFSRQLDLEFTRPFDGAVIYFARYVLVLGSIPEKVPQVWTTAVEGLIFSIIRDPPGGASTATLVEGSTISTSMAINGMHAAKLDGVDKPTGLVHGNSHWSASGGVQGGIRISAAPWGIGTIFKGFGFGTSQGGGGHKSTSVSVSRGSSQHFDIGLSFDVALSTSDSPYLAGQPSDLIIGGGANIRFIEAIEIYARPYEGGGLCLRGLETVQFLPETVTSYVMSVYEIEQTMLRLGDALKKQSEGQMNFTGNITVADLEKQISTWESVLAKYRKTTTSTSAKSVAAQLDEVLQNLTQSFSQFWTDLKDDTSSELASFVADGIEDLTAKKNEVPPSVGGGTYKGHGGGVTEKANQLKSSSFRSGDFLSAAGDVAATVTSATAKDCATAAGVLDGGAGSISNLCDVYQAIGEKADLVKTLMGVCSFPSKIPSLRTFCKQNQVVPSVAASSPAKSSLMSAFDFLTDTSKFLTFSGTSGTDISWNVKETRGIGHTVTTDGSMSTGWSYDGNFGFQVGRRLTDESRSRSGPVSLAGYAYPASGPVHAVSKKLLEVTPEMLEERMLEEKRRRLLEEDEEDETAEDQEHRKLVTKSRQARQHGEILAAARHINKQAEHTRWNAGVVGGGCRRRRRLQIGIQGCVKWGYGGSHDFSVSMSNSANNAQGHTHSVAVHLKDPNVQDSFVLSMTQDPVYGTPIFTTFGGRSTCVGETGTTKRDSRVTIYSIQPLCAKTGEKCTDPQKCACKGLDPGQDAIFSVVLQNLSPWEADVRYTLRASAGASTHWFDGKYEGKIECDPGDPGSLDISAIGLTGGAAGMRDEQGITLNPLPYGQYEVRFKVSRPDSFTEQCFSYSKIELQLVSTCEKPDFAGNEEVYQYDTSSIDPKTGDFKVVHPVYDNTTYAFKAGTAALGSASSTATFDVSWSSSQATPQPTTVAAAELLLEAKSGCTYSEASNYDATATLDNGSCRDFQPARTSPGQCPEHLHGISDERDCPDSTEALKSCTAGGHSAGDYCKEDGTCTDGHGSVCHTSARRNLRHLLQGGQPIMMVGKLTASPAPSSAPTAEPSATPTGSPAPSISAVPTSLPTEEPTLAPTSTFAPTRSETYAPTRAMTNAPSYTPTTDTYAPSSMPSATAAPTSA